MKIIGWKQLTQCWVLTTPHCTRVTQLLFRASVTQKIETLQNI